MLFVQLTELPHKECIEKSRVEIFKSLHYYKLHFLAPKIVSTLFNHVMEIMNQEGERNDKQD